MFVDKLWMFRWLVCRLVTFQSLCLVFICVLYVCTFIPLWILYSYFLCILISMHYFSQLLWVF